MSDSNVNLNAIRQLIASAIDERIAFEEKTQGGDKTIKQLQTLHETAYKLGDAPLVFSASVSFPWDAFINSHRISTARCNIYAIPKVWTLMEAMMAGKFTRLFDSDPATIATTILAMGEGITNEKDIATRVNVLMTGLRRWQAFNECVARGPKNILSAWERHKNFVYSYASGPTQAGSTIRAMEGLGLVRNIGKEGNCKLWKFASLDSDTKKLIESAYSAIVARFYPTPDKSPMGPKKYPALPVRPFLLDNGYQETPTDDAKAETPTPSPELVPVLPTQESLSLLDAIATEQGKAETPTDAAKAEKPKKATTPRKKVTKPKTGETVSLAEIAKTAKAEKTKTPRKSRAKKAETETPVLELSK